MTVRRNDATRRATAEPGDPSQATSYYVITANDVLDGGVRYLRLAGSGCEWTTDAAAATAADDVDRRDDLLAAAETSVRRNIVVAPYAIEVESASAGVTHRSTRERIRDRGPTTGIGTRK